MDRRTTFNSHRTHGIYLIIATVLPISLFVAVMVYDMFLLDRVDGRTCPLGSFQCHSNSSVCVSQANWCDKKIDCPNREDENPLTCYNQRAFLDVFIKSYGLFGIGVTTCDQQTFPKYCNCNLAGRIACENAGLKKIPAHVFSDNVKKLTLKYNEISEIKVADWNNLTELIILNLENNRIKTLHADAFSVLTNLRTLKLSENLLTTIVAGTFRGLTNLSTLFLDGNSLREIPKGVFDGLDSLQILNIHSNQLTLEFPNELFAPPSCRIIQLHSNKIRVISKSLFSELKQLEILTLYDNEIEKIEDNAFKAEKLLELDLAQNRLTRLPEDFRRRSWDLQYLSLANNLIDYIEPGGFDGLVNLTQLNMTGVRLRVDKVPRNLFRSMERLLTVHFHSFDMCRYTPTVRSCIPHGDGISSVENLLDISIQRICIWIVGFLTCLGNALVMVCRIWFREKNLHSLFIKNLAAADFMMGIYLLIIASHDALFRGHYNYYSLAWMDGWTCQAAGFLAMLSCEVSVLLLTAMSLECCMTITRPYLASTIGGHVLSMRQAVVLFATIWFVGAGLAAAPLSAATPFGDDFYSSNGVCMPLHIHEPFQPGWLYSAFIFLGINMVAAVAIVWCYAAMCHSVRLTRARTEVTSGEGQDDSVAKRFFAIVLTNLLCWIPLGVVKIIAFCNVDISAELYAWLSVFVLPINSCLNPIIYTITTPAFQRRVAENCACWHRIASVLHVENLFSRFAKRRHSSKVSTAAVSLLLGSDYLSMEDRRLTPCSFPPLPGGPASHSDKWLALSTVCEGCLGSGEEAQGTEEGPRPQLTTILHG